MAQRQLSSFTLPSSPRPGFSLVATALSPSLPTLHLLALLPVVQSLVKPPPTRARRRRGSCQLNPEPDRCWLTCFWQFKLPVRLHCGPCWRLGEQRCPKHTDQPPPDSRGRVRRRGSAS